MEVKRALVGDRASQVLGTRCSARSEVRPSSAPPPVDDELVAEAVEIPSADEGSEPRAGKGRTRALNELALANSALPPETPGGGVILSAWRLGCLIANSSLILVF